MNSWRFGERLEGKRKLAKKKKKKRKKQYQRTLNAS